MTESLKTLLSSKRVLVGLTTLLAMILVRYLNLEEARADELAETIAMIGLALIGGISVSDHGKAMGKPKDTDHKGRPASGANGKAEG